VGFLVTKKNRSRELFTKSKGYPIRRSFIPYFTLYYNLRRYKILITVSLEKKETPLTGPVKGQ
jgi:hypothetical protein